MQGVRDGPLFRTLTQFLAFHILLTVVDVFFVVVTCRGLKFIQQFIIDQDM